MIREHGEITFDRDTEPLGGQGDIDAPTTTQPTVPVYNSLVKFLGEHSPQTNLPCALDYQVTWINNRIVGHWICIQCSFSNEDIAVVMTHISTQHILGQPIKCNVCDDIYTSVCDLDEH